MSGSPTRVDSCSVFIGSRNALPRIPVSGAIEESGCSALIVHRLLGRIGSQVSYLTFGDGAVFGLMAGEAPTKTG